MTDISFSDNMITVINEPAVFVQNLSRTYMLGQNQKIEALKNINLQINSGSFIAVKGRSGSGKTTLLNCLGGLDRPTTGIIRIFNRDITKIKDAELTRWRREKLGFIFQSFGLLPTLSAFENVELVLRIAGWVWKKRRDRAQMCVELVGLKKWLHHRPYELSGGQQQRLAIARSLANQPELILADEPTGELDSQTAREILELMKTLTIDLKTTIIIASHDPLVDEYVDQILYLKDGTIFDSP